MRIPVFVVGAARAGTTLLSVLLDRHSQLAMTPETDFYREIAPWLRLAPVVEVERILRRWSRFAELGPTPEQLTARCGRAPVPGALLDAVLDLFAAYSEKERCGEKAPLHLRYVSRILSDFPEARILCIYRDGLDAALSLHAMPWGPPSLETAARAWLKAVRLIWDAERTYPDRFRMIQYEDLLAAPREQMTTAMGFLDLGFQERQLEAGPSGVILERSQEWRGRRSKRWTRSWVGTGKTGHRRKT